MDNDEAELDIKLAAYSKELRTVTVPAELESRILSSMEQHQGTSKSAKRAERAVDKFWIWAGCAASIAAVSISLLFTGDTQENKMRHVANRPTVNTITSYPVRVHSLSQGAQWRYVQSHTVKDQRGVTRLLVVNPQGEFNVQ